MTVVDAVTLFGIMFVLALIPSSSVVLVTARAATAGFSNGAAVAFGIVLGDLVFVVLTITGLVALAETLGVFFVAIKYIGGAYLVWLGLGLFKSAFTPKSVVQNFDNEESKKPVSLLASFLAGLALTLGDIKAIFFYLSLFPAFIDMSVLSAFDVSMLVLITVVAVGGVKLGYAYAASKANSMIRLKNFGALPLDRGLKAVSGTAMVGAGVYLIVKA